MRRFVSVLVAMAWLGLAASAAAQSQAVGTMRVFGAWNVGGRTVANDTTAVYDGMQVSIAGAPSAEQRRASRVVLYYSVPGQDPLQCLGTEPCAGGFHVRARGSPDPLLARILSYLDPEAEPDIAAARAATPAIPDGVVLRTGARLDLGTLLGTVPPGAYRIVVTARNAAAASVVANSVITVGKGTESIDAPGTGDGLYALQLFEPSTLAPASNVAWFAAAAAPGYAERRAAYNRAVAATAAWSPTAENRAAASALLRDLVVALADPAWRP